MINNSIFGTAASLQKHGVIDEKKWRGQSQCLTAFLSLGAFAFALQTGLNNTRTSATIASSSSFQVSETAISRHVTPGVSPFRIRETPPVQENEPQTCREKMQSQLPQQLAANTELQYPLAAHLAKTYRITPRHASDIVDTVVKVGHDHHVDPFLILGIIAKESSFNLAAKSGYGATGLMQVHAPSHRALLKTLGLNVSNLRSAEKSLQSEVHINVTAGVRIYKQYENQYASPVQALQAYNGTKTDSTTKYARSVLALRDAFSSQAAELACA